MELEDSIKNILKEMKAEYATSLPEKVSVLTSHWAVVRKNQASEEQFDKFAKTVHHLSGTAGTLGFPEISEAAKEFENRFTAVDLGRGGAVGPTFLADLDLHFRTLMGILTKIIQENGSEESTQT